MLSRPLQRLGKHWIAHWNLAQRVFQNGQPYKCVKWTEYCSWVWCSHLNPQDFPASWNRKPHNHIRNCSIHLCPANMKSEGDEPTPKRRRCSEDQDISCSPNEQLSTSFPNETSLLRNEPQIEEEILPKPRAGVIKRSWEYFCQQSKKMKILEEDRQISQDDKDLQEKFDFTVMSYNILSQDLLEDNSHLYKHCRHQILSWNYRFPNILSDIKQLDADVLCLQEVQEDQYGKEIKPSLEALGYHCEYKMRTGRKPDGCAICFKTSKFSLLSSNPVEFFRRNIPLLDRDNVGLVVLLQPRFHCKATAAICVANTHLLYNPRRGDIKLTQLAMLLAEITNVAIREDGRFYPLVLCGDFNSVPHSPLYNFLRDGKLNYEGLPIGKVSGQEQSPKGKRILSIPIWPQSLGISQDCMYEEQQKQLEKERERGEAKENTLEAAEEIVMISQRLPTDLHHSFQLSSAYTHYLPDSGLPEVTTCHSRGAVTVDYIFFSEARDSKSEQSEEKLKALGLDYHSLLALSQSEIFACIKKRILEVEYGKLLLAAYKTCSPLKFGLLPRFGEPALYLSILLDPKLRRPFSQARFNVIPSGMLEGRFFAVALEDRLCPCGTNNVETLAHMILYCPLYSHLCRQPLDSILADNKDKSNEVKLYVLLPVVELELIEQIAKLLLSIQYIHMSYESSVGCLS